MCNMLSLDIGVLDSHEIKNRLVDITIMPQFAEVTAIINVLIETRFQNVFLIIFNASFTEPVLCVLEEYCHFIVFSICECVHKQS